MRVTFDSSVIYLYRIQLTYCKRIMFNVYDIWRTLKFRLFNVDFILRFIKCTHSYRYICTFSDVLDLAGGITQPKAQKRIHRQM